jgi:hypothetical protein
MDPRHLLVYVSWDVIRRWKRGRRPDPPVAAAAPYAYGSAQVRLARLARPGDVIWVLTAPRFAGYRLPPSLIARLQVAQVVDRQTPAGLTAPIPPDFDPRWRYVALAQPPPASRYYPLNNAYQTLLALTFVGRAPTLRDCPHCQQLVAEQKRLYAGLPAHLQTVRHLTPGAGAALEAFARAVAEGQIVFLSYRRAEAAPLATTLMEHLTDQGVACWWDHWMLPGRVARGDTRIDNDLLSAVLADGLRQSTWAVALVTPLFHRSRWTAQEWTLAGEERDNPRRTRPLRRIEVLLGGEASGQADVVLPGAGVDPNRLAAQLLVAINEQSDSE